MKNLSALMGFAMACLLFVPGCKLVDDIKKKETKKGVLLATSATFGKILTDSTGRTLYSFAPDVKGTPTCVGNCEVVWPPFYTANPTTQDGLNAADFATVTRPDGKKQSAYKGWPIYYYKDDAALGDIKGDKIGNVWFVAKPDYTLMIGRTQMVGNDGKNYTQQRVEGTGAFTFITDAYGRTLYAFNNDRMNDNNFTRADFSNNTIWPINENTIEKFPSIFTATDISNTDVFGKKQLTYKGWPLYYFGPDAMTRGNTKGVSVNNWQIAFTAMPAALPN